MSTYLRYPASGTILRIILFPLPFLTTRTDMRDVVVLYGFLATVCIVIGLVTTQILGFLLARLRALDYYRLQGFSQ
jgi:hypothetical protein